MRLVLASLLAIALVSPALAADMPQHMDDTVSFDLSAEDWVTTKTAHVSANVEAAVSAANAGTMRADMTKAITDAAKGDWRLTNFNRTQDQTGMERWSVTFDARLPESALNGLADAMKKASKPGLQVTVGDVDFGPTLEENEAARAVLRAHIAKDANEQLTAINTALPGRAYRISQIAFEPSMSPMPMLRANKPMMAMSSMASGASADAAPEHAQKLVLTAHIVLAALPPAPATAH